MLGLSHETEVNKVITKKAIYTKFGMDNALRTRFDADIARLTIVNELTQRTTNITPGENTNSIFVINVTLKRQNFDKNIISKLTKLIDQRLVLALTYGDKLMLAINYDKLQLTEWIDSEQCILQLQGLTLDMVWENIVRQIVGVQYDTTQTLTEQISNHEERQKIMAEIHKLQDLMMKEHQPHKKFEYNEMIRKLKEKI